MLFRSVPFLLVGEELDSEEVGKQRVGRRGETFLWDEEGQDQGLLVSRATNLGDLRHLV